LRLPQERARSFGQLGIHEHELGREQPFEGVLVNETNRRSFRKFFEYANARGVPRRRSIGEGIGPEHAPLE
jgi:hypothetical protein